MEHPLPAFIDVVRKWRLRDAEAAAVLGLPVETYGNWRENPAAVVMDEEQANRISSVLAIAETAHDLFGNLYAIREWLRHPHDHTVLNDQIPLDLMKLPDSSGLAAVQTYLEGWRSLGW